MNKKRLTLLLTDAQVRIIKSKAALAGMTGSAWIIEQLDLDTALEDQVPDVDDVSGDLLTAYSGPDTDQDPEPGVVDQVADDTALDAQEVQEPVTAQVHPPMSERDARDWKLVEIERKYPHSGNAQKRVDILNESGVLLNGVAGQWTKRNASNAIRNARKHLGVKKP